MPEGPPSAGKVTLDPEVISSLGRQIFEAERDRRPIAPITDAHPTISVADAYAVQQEYARLRSQSGALVIGHKIGATSRAIQEFFGINTPDYGHLFNDMLHDETQELSLGGLIQPLVEPEIAFVLDSPLTGPNVTAEGVVAASRGVVACIEVIDSRVENWKIKLPDTIADNGSSARFVVSSQVVPIEQLDLAGEAVVLTRNGEVVGEGTGSDVLGHPAMAAAWLANALSGFGAVLPAGAYVLSGSMTTAVAAKPGDRFRADFTNLGSVSCMFDGKETNT